MIPVFKPFYGQEEIDAVSEVLKSSWIGLGPKTKEFEEQFAKYIGVDYAAATNSATSSLHLAMKVMNIDGGEVITTPMTFISTNHAILYNNATPVFCDIEPDTLNIDSTKIEALITKNTKAIVVVHFGGYMCDMDPILEIAKKYNLKIIEDASHAAGAEYKGRKAGSIGDIGCFSFHAVKNLATGDGGMVTTNDPEIYSRLIKLRWLGITKDTWSREEKDSSRYSWYYDVEEMGYKYHMNDITASLGIVQLGKLDKANSLRQKFTEKYNNFLKDKLWIEAPMRMEYTKPSYHNYVIKTDYRDALNDFLKDKGVSTGVHYIPNNHYEMYKKYGQETPISSKVWKKLLTLPLYPSLTDEDFNIIINSINEFEKDKISS